MTEPLILAIDAGTSATKVAVVDLEGQILASATESYPTLHPRPGWVEQDPEVMFATALEATRACMAAVNRERVSAVVCSAQRATWIPLGRDLRAQGNYVGWQDTRGAAQRTRIESTLGEHYTERTGMRLDAVASLSKILWYLEHADVGATHVFGGHQTMLLGQLGVKEALISPSEASYLGLLDLQTRDWAADVADTVGLDTSNLPRIVESGTVVGCLASDIATRMGVREGLPVVMGGGDLQLGALGVGAGQDGVVAVGIGTGGGAVAPCQTPTPDRRGRLNCLAHVVPGLWEVEGLGSAAGGTFRWFRDTFGGAELELAQRTGQDTYDLLVQQASAEDPATGLLVIPSLAGLGSPHHDADFSGALLGLRLHHRRGQIIRAFMEGIALEQRAILETVQSLVGEVRQVRLWGGAAKSDAWCEMQVNAYELPGSRCRVADASLIGAAICGAVGIKAVAGFDEAVSAMVRVADTWQPDPQETARCRRYFQTYQRAVEVMKASLSDDLHRLDRDSTP